MAPGTRIVTQVVFFGQYKKNMMPFLSHGSFREGVKNVFLKLRT